MFVIVPRVPAATWLGASMSIAVQGSQLRRAEIEAILKRLSDPDAAARVAAEQELLLVGPDVIPFLPAVDPRQDADFRERLGRVRRELERAHAELAAAASSVTLEGTLTLPEALQEIERQTGNRVLDYRRRFGGTSEPVAVSLRAQGEPFWSVIDSILRKKQLALYPFSGEPNAVAIVPAADGVGQALTSYDRVFRVEATKLFAVRDLRDPFQTGLRLSLEMVWEPRLNPILVKQLLGEFEAIDDLGQKVKSTSSGMVESPVLEGVGAVECTIPLELPSREARMLKSIRGKAVAIVPGSEITLEFPDLKVPAQTKRHANVTATLVRVRRNDELLDVQFQVRMDDSQEAGQSHYAWMGSNAAFLRDAKGNELQPEGMETVFQREGEFGVSYKFDVVDPQGWTFVYRTPSAILSVPFQFEFHDVLLP